MFLFIALIFFISETVIIHEYLIKIELSLPFK